MTKVRNKLVLINALAAAAATQNKNCTVQRPTKVLTRSIHIFNTGRQPQPITNFRKKQKVKQQQQQQEQREIKTDVVLTTQPPKMMIESLATTSSAAVVEPQDGQLQQSCQSNGVRSNSAEQSIDDKIDTHSVFSLANFKCMDLTLPMPHKMPPPKSPSSVKSRLSQNTQPSPPPSTTTTANAKMQYDKDAAREYMKKQQDQRKDRQKVEQKTKEEEKQMIKQRLKKLKETQKNLVKASVQKKKVVAQKSPEPPPPQPKQQTMARRVKGRC